MNDEQLFEAYALSDLADDRNPPYTIAFRQSALMLETVIWYWKPKGNEKHGSAESIREKGFCP